MKAIPEQVKKFTEQTSVSPYKYYVEYLDIDRNKPVMRTFAYQNTKTNGFRIQEVIREYLDHIEVNDCFYCVGGAGWLVQWKNSKSHSYYYHCWKSDYKFYYANKRPNIFASQIQTEKEFEEILKNYIPYFYLPKHIDASIMVYAKAYKEFPNLELLAKAGLGYFCTDKMMLKCKGQRMKQILRWLNENKEYVNNYHPTYQFISMALKNGENGQQCYERCMTMNDQKYLKRYNIIKTYEEMVEIRKYLKKQNEDIVIYKDYLQMSEKLGRDLLDKSVLFPRNLRLSHDSIQELVVDKENKAISRKLKNKYKKFVRFACEVGDFKIIVPDKVSDFVKWGNTLHNCVGSNGYCNSMANGNCIIVGIFRKNKIVECCELNKKLEIVQLRGNHNQDSRYHKKAKELVNLFINNVKTLQLANAGV